MIRSLLQRMKRDPLLLILTFLIGPFFVLLYKMIFLEGMTLYRVILIRPEKTIEQDDSELLSDYQRIFIDAMEGKHYSGGGDLFHFMEAETLDQGLKMLRNHDAHCLLRFTGFPEDPEIQIIGDYSNPYYLLCSQLIQNNVKDFVIQELDLPPPVGITEVALGNSGSKTEFENYIPGLVIFSVLTLMYLFSILLQKEVESNVFSRYRISGLPGHSFIISYTLCFLLLSTVAALLTLGTAFALGFHSPVSLLNDLLLSLWVCLILSLSTAGIAFMVASLAANTSQAFILCTFPFMLMVFFSGSVYPFPKLTVLQVQERAIGLFDVLPSTHAVSALGKILTFGVRFSQLSYETTALTALSLLFFTGGAALFLKRRWN